MLIMRTMAGLTKSVPRVRVFTGARACMVALVVCLLVYSVLCCFNVETHINIAYERVPYCISYRQYLLRRARVRGARAPRGATWTPGGSTHAGTPGWALWDVVLGSGRLAIRQLAEVGGEASRACITRCRALDDAATVVRERLSGRGWGEH
eukprot:COSAG02_NODE_467_length_21771_cov_39.020303_11_plen_151_part_00